MPHVYTPSLGSATSAPDSHNPSSDKFVPRVIAHVPCACPDLCGSAGCPSSPLPLAFQPLAFQHRLALIPARLDLDLNIVLEIHLQPYGDQAYIYVTGTQTRACKV